MLKLFQPNFSSFVIPLAKNTDQHFLIKIEINKLHKVLVKKKLPNFLTGKVDIKTSVSIFVVRF